MFSPLWPKSILGSALNITILALMDYCGRGEVVFYG